MNAACPGGTLPATPTPTPALNTIFTDNFSDSDIGSAWVKWNDATSTHQQILYNGCAAVQLKA